jgi:hypothetical protein
MKPDQQHLLHDLFEDESRRESTLLAATNLLRRRRQWRIACRLLALILLAAVSWLLVEQNQPRHQLAHISPPKAIPPALPPPQSLTDDQLLLLFPNTPVGLATLPNGKKLLIFPRPGDAAKYVTRM